MSLVKALSPKPALRCVPISSRAMALAVLAGMVCACLMAVVCSPAANATGYGIEDASVLLSGPGGGFSRQAGAHPDFTTHFDINYDHETGLLYGNVKDVSVELPPGFLANPAAVPTCPIAKLANNMFEAECPADSQVGFAYLQVFGPTGPGGGWGSAVYNLPHPPGSPALFGMNVLTVPVFIQAQVRPSDFGVTGLSARTSEAYGVFGADVTLWGVPADHGTGAPRRPFFRSATSCPGTPSVFSIGSNSWQFPDAFDVKPLATDAQGTPLVNEGCKLLAFAPSVTSQTSARRTASASGIDVDIKVPQNEDPDGLATADVRKTVVRFPEGVTVSPSAASGLGSCSKDEMKLGTNDAPACPDSSKLGSVTIKTPLLDEELKGNVILAKQDDNPFNTLLALYIAVKGPGFYLKLPGKVDLDPVTGQLTTTFDDTPQLPFDELKLSLNSGPRAALETPSACGTYWTHVEMTSWASSVPVGLDTPMTIDDGCLTGGFAPVLHAGASNPVAGASSSFVLQVTRQDGEQNIARIQATLPEGELAKLAGVPLCDEAAAAIGGCPAASQVGTTLVGAGVGSSPVYLPEAGHPPTAVFLAGPYRGAPYSLVIEVPAQAGPFDLGTVVVRAGIYIDPVTARATVTSDPLPQILQGIPVSYRDIRVEVTRPGFTINPTNCTPMSVDSQITSSQGTSATPAARFQVGDCASLAFRPKFTAASSARASRANGASLSVKLAYPAGTTGQANVGAVKVALPKQLPSRLTTLQKACLAQVFAVNPANCPAASVVGHATVSTPLLAAPLSGPAYFVSHGGEAFPSLTIVLQGNGVTVQLVGSTFISKQGITSSTFKAVPDVPFTSFALTLPQGKFSALAANGNLCKQALKMPTDLVAQNGLVIHQSTKIAVTGCPKAKTATRAQKLAVALRACKKKAKRARSTCETAAHKKYAPAKKGGAKA